MDPRPLRAVAPISNENTSIPAGGRDGFSALSPRSTNAASIRPRRRACVQPQIKFRRLAEALEPGGDIDPLAETGVAVNRGRRTGKRRRPPARYAAFFAAALP
ncbi:hypothetical protein DFR50_10772 [Roseiarcus fermentans]|uniref:Uncharacterized protein n=1 Tax=Roseiarcus fermentans TaxID=1473586 RepID=A0A366FMD2_9HYPH|nr:hypothetical protein DFR50_10772 [Roseiarcus fermentans]